MSQRITIRDVAREAGVSVGTASRVMNAAPNVAAAVRERVEAAVAKLDYKPDPAAQSMRSGATRTVGIMVRDITVPALAGFVREAQDSLHRAGYALLITCSEDSLERELDLLRMLADRRVDGLITTVGSETSPELAAAHEALPMPIVLLDREPSVPRDAVLLDHRGGTRRAIDYLSTLGHRRVGLITGASSVYPGRERLRAFQEAARLGLIDDGPQLFRTRAFDADSAFFEASALFAMADPPTAVIAGGIAMLSGLVRSARVRGLRIPADVSVIGAADSDLALLSTPPISVVRWSYAELGRSCARLLLERMQPGRAPEPRRIVYPTEFLMRESCGPPRAASGRAASQTVDEPFS